jgi:hypothetical protein
MNAQTWRYAMFPELQLIHPLGHRVWPGDRARYCGDGGRHHSAPLGRCCNISGGLYPLPTVNECPACLWRPGRH